MISSWALAFSPIIQSGSAATIHPSSGPVHGPLHFTCNFVSDRFTCNQCLEIVSAYSTQDLTQCSPGAHALRIQFIDENLQARPAACLYGRIIDMRASLAFQGAKPKYRKLADFTYPLCGELVACEGRAPIQVGVDHSIMAHGSGHEVDRGNDGGSRDRATATPCLVWRSS